ncbi:hypothetical protein RhiJN_01628 [Ceratobasidium sp. AG-Ba]|nr:hypothetical protein RhiJN_01628 [Ceratobasidium sp. AG-Ba]QRW02557.1 hypothetical protein RhiLY_01556 [Ceratobasidium sp. AG-Ba]
MVLLMKFERRLSPPPQDTHDEEGTPSDEESGEERCPDAQEQDDAWERESTSPSAGKRKSREAGCGDYDGPPSEDEEPLKKRRQRNTSHAVVPESDKEEDQGEAQRDPDGDGREPKTPSKTPNTNSSSKANDDPALGGTVPGDRVPSSPLSESPDDSSAVVKRATRLSSQAAQSAPLADEAMKVALEKRKQEEVEKRERAAQKKKEEAAQKAEEDAAFKELERQVKGAKPAKEKTKTGTTKRAPRKKK